MATYGIVWRILCRLLIAVGVLLGVVALPVVLWVLVPPLAVTLWLTAVVDRSSEGERVVRDRVSAIVRAGSVCLAGLVQR
jgi:hypothetical protein